MTLSDQPADAAKSVFDPFNPEAGDRLALDLANTIDPRYGPHRRDKLTSYPLLAAWGRHAGILTADQEQSLLALASEQPAAAGRVLDRARDLRETIYRIFSAITAGQPPRRADLDVLRDRATEALRHAQLQAEGAGFVWAWSDAGSALDGLLWPVAQAALDLLFSAELPRVRECPGGQKDCGWLFVDLTKNGSRRWCSMETCGSRAKMRRHYARKRAERGT
jgi:predicted RNA-binding Zn ribbon-like protein